MNIDRIIRTKREERNLTQEQLASCLGVSAPVVSKWEKGLSHPDITLLSPLARLLGVDINTLLSFHESLTDEEISAYLNAVVQDIEAEGYATVFQRCVEKIKEYPTCDKLILNTAIVLKGSLYLHWTESPQPFEDTIQGWIQHCAHSGDTEICHAATSLLIDTAIAQMDFQKAEAHIESLPTMAYDKARLRGSLHLAKGDYPQAAKTLEAKLVHMGTDIFATLVSLMEIAVKENRPEAATHLASIVAQTTAALGLWEYNTHAAYVQLYILQADEDNLFSALQKMLQCAEVPFGFSNSTLYTHIQKREIAPEEHRQFVQGIITMWKAEAQSRLGFVKNQKRFDALLEQYSDSNFA